MDFAVVLNAGSSSLKFCVYRRPDQEAWELGARGQIEGIGTSPRFSAKDGSGKRLADDVLDQAVVRARPSAPPRSCRSAIARCRRGWSG